mmetsp:Transcript_27032/g.37105  ORF Transcript_27032/g.37105 Transcript_27032/m.37105 type:complete len:260 (+) Transcript_27032:1044-1823(+)
MRLRIVFGLSNFSALILLGHFYPALGFVFAYFDFCNIFFLRCALERFSLHLCKLCLTKAIQVAPLIRKRRKCVTHEFESHAFKIRLSDMSHFHDELGSIFIEVVHHQCSKNLTLMTFEDSSESFDQMLPTLSKEVLRCQNHLRLVNRDFLILRGSTLVIATSVHSLSIPIVYLPRRNLHTNNAVDGNTYTLDGFGFDCFHLQSDQIQRKGFMRFAKTPYESATSDYDVFSHAATDELCFIDARYDNISHGALMFFSCEP